MVRPAVAAGQVDPLAAGGDGGAPRHRPVRQAAAADPDLRHAGGGADLRALRRQLPHHLADRPPHRRPARRAGGGRGARRRRPRPAAHGAAAHGPGARRGAQARQRAPAGAAARHRLADRRHLRLSRQRAPQGHVERAWAAPAPDLGRARRVRGQGGPHHQGDRRARHGRRRLHRGGAAGGAAEGGHDPLRPQRHGAVGDHLGDHGGARLFCPQRPAGAADDAHYPQHAALQPEPGGRQPHHRALAAAGRDRHRRARAGAHAGGADADPAAEEPARRARAGRQQDQPRPAQHAGQRAADLGPPVQPARPGGAALRAEADRLARPRHHARRQHAEIRPRRGGAAQARAVSRCGRSSTRSATA